MRPVCSTSSIVQRHERAHGPLGTAGDVERASDHVEEPIHRNGGEERRHQNRVQPPGREVHRLGGAHVDSAQQRDIDQPADDRPVRQLRLHLGVMNAQRFHRETGDAEREKQSQAATSRSSYDPGSACR